MLAIGLEDFPDQLAQLGVLEILELAYLAVAKRVQTPSWL
jgi:hypothetical protein